MKTPRDAICPLVLLFVGMIVLAATSPAADDPPGGCLACHDGIEPIRQSGSGMMEAILEEGQSLGDPAGCVVCHGGDPRATDKEAAHGGDAFHPDPGSPWINAETCGKCHNTHVKVQWQSLMMTEAGKIQGTAWAFGLPGAEEHRWANYDVSNPKTPRSRLGTDAYRAYMEHLAEIEPQVYVDSHEALPEAVTDPSLIAENPQLAAFTYLRNHCLRCHHAVQGRQVRGDYRGLGCSTCHIPYGNEGLYEGDDPTITRDEPGHLLVHSIQGTRKSQVEVHGQRYSGIPVETCTTCHNRGKRIGVSFQGLMEMPYTSSYSADGQGQPGLHTKHYMAMHQDIHGQIGMLCQDCHTSGDVHGDGFLCGTTLGAVEIECSDCHGTTEAFPWELPQGYGDEFDTPLANQLDHAKPRGVSNKLLAHTRQGMVYPAADGYLLTTRGNPLPNVTRHGDLVVVHTAAGKDLELKPLKQIRLDKELSLSGKVAMSSVRGHQENMECYTCHAAWAPQCYGCHVKLDYSDGAVCTDWLAADDEKIAGRVEEQRSYTRWEDPPLGINGEGRVTPLIPGCQVSITVIGEDGQPILLNHIFRTPAGTEGAGPEGQLSLDMSPVQPHTITKTARTCESCHAAPKALGHGIAGGRLLRSPREAVTVDLQTADGRILPQSARVQMGSIAELEGDWSQFVDDQGRQTQTVGHHFSRSRPLDEEQRTRMEREGVCLACHQDIPDGSLAVSLLHHVAAYANQLPHSAKEHHSLIHKLMLLAAWIQITAAGLPLLAAGAGLIWFRRRRKRRRSGCA